MIKSEEPIMQPIDTAYNVLNSWLSLCLDNKIKDPAEIISIRTMMEIGNINGIIEPPM